MGEPPSAPTLLQSLLCVLSGSCSLFIRTPEGLALNHLLYSCLHSGLYWSPERRWSHAAASELSPISASSLRTGGFRRLLHVFPLFIPCYSPPNTLFFLLYPPPRPNRLLRGPTGARQYKFPFIPVAGADDTAALPHRLTSPQMPIYCTWQPLWSRRTSGVEYAH